MDVFDRALQKTLKIEGGYSNDPSDSGGQTRFGITEAVARANGYTGPMKDLPIAIARDIFLAQYWNLLNLYKVAEVNEAVAEELFDTAVNCGIGIAGKILQRSLNVLNREEKDFQDIRVDGLIGPMTIFALRGLMAVRGADGESVLLKVINSLQGARYVELAEARRKDEKYTFGWFKERVKL